MDIDHIFTAYKRPLTVIAIQGYVYKIMNKMFKRSINKNKHDTKKQQLMPCSWPLMGLDTPNKMFCYIEMAVDIH
jgi:hypothetical protein